MGESVLVTGGAGFIGSHLVEALAGKGYDVRVLDDLSITRDNLPFIERAGAEFVKADITDPDAVLREMKGCDHVFHLAAMNRAMKSVLDPKKSHDVNATGTVNVLEAAKKNGVDKVVYVSSSSVYGLSDIFPRVETQRPMPAHPYAVGKLVSEHYCNVYSHLYGLKTVVLRYFSVFGPRQRGDIAYAAVISKFMDRLSRGEPLEVYGDGGQTRNFTYVKDTVKATVMALESDAAVGNTFNVASETDVSVNDLIRHLEVLLGKTAEVSYVDPLPGDIRHNPPDLSRIRDVLGFGQDYSFEDGLRETVGWFKNQ